MSLSPLARSVAVPLLAVASACSACSVHRPPAEVASPAAAAGAELAGDLRTAEVATVGWDSATASPVVLLREVETGQLVPIWVGIAEAQAIASALHEVAYPRPMTHDLMANLLQRLDARLDELVIHDVVDGTYYGMLKLRVDGGEPVLVDTRPSDGLALALRAGATIRLSQEILEETPEVDFHAPDEPDQVVRALGLTVVAPSAELREEFSLPDRPGLVVIRAVGRAADEGIRRGDLLLEVGGVPAATPLDFLETVRDAPLGAPLAVRYWSDGEERETSLAPDEPERRRTAPKRVA